MSDATKQRVDRASRLIAASPDDVYGAFVDANAVVKWLPPQGARGSIEAFEPREGGRFRMQLVFEPPHAKGKSGSDSDVVDGTFERLVPGQQVVQRFAFVSDDPQFAGIMTMRWTFDHEGQETRVSVAAENVPRGISSADHQKGLDSLANLAAYVERN